MALDGRCPDVAPPEPGEDGDDEPVLEAEPEPASEAVLAPAPSAAFDPESPPPDPVAVGDSDVDFDEDPVELRSFFAQPDPLKTIVGGANALRTGASPQTGHVAGPASWTPWITSNRCPFGQT